MAAALADSTDSVARDVGSVGGTVTGLDAVPVRPPASSVAASTTAVPPAAADAGRQDGEDSGASLTRVLLYAAVGVLGLLLVGLIALGVYKCYAKRREWQQRRSKASKHHDSPDEGAATSPPDAPPTYPLGGNRRAAATTAATPDGHGGTAKQKPKYVSVLDDPASHDAHTDNRPSWMRHTAAVGEHHADSASWYPVKAAAAAATPPRQAATDADPRTAPRAGYFPDDLWWRHTSSGSPRRTAAEQHQQRHHSGDALRSFEVEICSDDDNGDAY